LLQQLIEFFNTEPGSPNYGPGCTPIQFFVIWHNHLAERIISSQYDVATFLSFEIETNLFEGLNTITAGKHQWGQVLYCNILEVSGVNELPRSKLRGIVRLTHIFVTTAY
jgi:hypothetical protein